MSDALYLVLSVCAGILLGVFFFAGLWWTVKKGVSFSHPALLFVASMIVRIGAVLFGFYFVSRGHWERFLGCLVGFVIARIIVTRLTKLPVKGAR